MIPFAVPRAVANFRSMVARGRSKAVEPRTEPEPVVFTNADGTPNREPALQGVACLYDKPFTKDGQIVIFDYGCFSSSIYDPTVERKVLFDHNDGDVVGSTADGLVFANNADGLMYRLPLAGNSRAADVKKAVDSSRKACASVGCRITESEPIDVDGSKGTRILKAELFEVSLVHQGAVDGTSASVVNLRDEEPDLRTAARTLGFAINKLISNISTSTLRVADGIRRLNNDIAQLDDGQPSAPRPVTERITASTLCRWQTAQTEALQAHAIRHMDAQ